MRLAVLTLCTVLSAGCSSALKMVAPSNHRTWEPDQAVLPHAEFRGEQVIVHNVRNCRHLDGDSYIVQHEDRTYNLRDVRSVDFIVVPFTDMPRLAHTMLSFNFEPPDGPPQQLALSIEIRKELGEEYAALKGGLRQYELMYVLADERDVVAARTNHRGEHVYLYETTATPDAARMLLVDVLLRTNELASRPEFYNTFVNNCTTNLRDHVNRIKPTRLNYDYRVLLPGYSDQLAYDEGLIKRHGTFEETRTAAYINGKALAAADRSDFSELIRR